MVRRPARSAFMPSVDVFPGGRLDEEDHIVAERLVQRSPSWQADTWPDPPAIRVAAWRELAEEAGVFLCSPREPSPSREELDAWRRAALQGDAGWLLHWMDQTRRTPDLSSFSPFARWVTPVRETRRFDAWFHVAMLPEGQVASSDEVETEEGRWVDLTQWREQMHAGGVVLAPPTFCALHVLSQHDSVPSILRNPLLGSTLEPLEPALVPESAPLEFALPWDPVVERVERTTPIPTGPNPYPSNRMRLLSTGWAFLET